MITLFAQKFPKTSKKPPGILILHAISSFAMHQLWFFLSAVKKMKNEVIVVTLVHIRSFLTHLQECKKTMKLMGGSETHL